MSTKTLKISSALPPFSLKSVDEKVYSPEMFSDKKVLIIIFSCNHCPYVQTYEKRIIELQRIFAEDIAIVAISSNDAVNYPEDSFEMMKKRAAEQQFNFPYLYDEDQSIAKAFDATHTPEVFLFNQERKLAFHGKIDDNWQEAENVKSRYLKEAIEEVLNDEEVSVPETFTIGCTIKWKD
ncbi:MAG: thioredoxin family protein [Ignavibacteriaceae bacterium]|nr:thioredoxin family protein [Ignavibacteriaceae bacterium]